MDLDLHATAPREIPYGRLAFAGFGVLAASLLAFAYVTGDGLGGEPVAVGPVEAAAPPAPAPRAAASPGDVTGAIAPPKRVATAEEVESQSGVKVTRQGGAPPPGALIIEVPEQPPGIHLTPAPDKRLVERSDRGLLPKIGAGGARPADIYARPVILPAALKAGAPRIAIVVGGMGLNQGGTSQAIAKLPGAVTLAFAPYGANLVAQAAEAREGGHEIMLQAPMESFDYPGNDPGPQTLLATDAGRNLERLHWLMGRFPGYVGIINYLGGKFTADADAFGPVLRDIADRGLIYADDGTSTRSLAGALAPRFDLPVVRTDIVIDESPRPEAIDVALIRLEAIARKKGLAVGSANGLPVTIERIARWAHALEGRGIALVPLSAAAERLPDASADGTRNER
ncbi:MAG: divergent polysaccharide deacetylase family protein [Methylobacteriaceae bacterium]|nr:divergent polysaccharide deacetylase family protein [Methylobacteriaceae bacterium]